MTLAVIRRQGLLLLLLAFLSSSRADSSSTIEVYKIGNNREPEDVYPLPECAGDCDVDQDVSCRYRLKYI